MIPSVSSSVRSYADAAAAAEISCIYKNKDN
jgi:hypothetical protein